MKRDCVYKQLLVCVISITLLLGICGCDMKLAYYLFPVENIEDSSVQDYFELEKLDFLRIGNVAIVPEMKGMNEYIVYISAYSQTGSEEVIVNKVSLSTADGRILFSNEELYEPIVMNKREENIVYWNGSITGGTCSMTTEEVGTIENFQLKVQVQVTDGQESQIAEICFYIKAVGYLMWVTRT